MSTIGRVNPLSIEDLQQIIWKAMAINPKTTYELEKCFFCVTKTGIGKATIDIST